MKRALNKTVALLLCAVFTVIPLVGCTQNIGDKQESQSFEAIKIDNYGRELRIEKKPQKVVTAGPNCSEVFVALGLTDLIVGNSADNHSRGPLTEYAEEYAKIPELTYGYPTMEAVVTSGADFVYGIDWVFGDDFSVENLEEYGITVYMNAATTYDDIWKEITDLGKIFEVEKAAQDFITKEKSELKAVTEKVKGQQPLKVLVYDSGGDTIYTAGGPNIETLFIETAGGENIFKDLDKAWVTASYEEVLKRDPDVIIIHDYDVPGIEEKINEIKAHPLLSGLTCVKNEKFIILSLEDALPGSRTSYCVKTIAKGCYPELFQN